MFFYTPSTEKYQILMTCDFLKFSHQLIFCQNAVLFNSNILPPLFRGILSNNLKSNVLLPSSVHWREVPENLPQANILRSLTQPA